MKAGKRERPVCSGQLDEAEQSLGPTLSRRLRVKLLANEQTGVTALCRCALRGLKSKAG